MVKSLALHILAMLLLLLLPTQALIHSARSKELDVVFYSARQPIEVKSRAALPPGTKGIASALPSRTEEEDRIALPGRMNLDLLLRKRQAHRVYLPALRIRL